MSTEIGKTVSEGMFDNSIEVYVGVNHVVLFVQNSLDRDGIGTKILLSPEKLETLREDLMLAAKAKGWTVE